jgi:hypothetical protein
MIIENGVLLSIAIQFNVDYQEHTLSGMKIENLIYTGETLSNGLIWKVDGNSNQYTTIYFRVLKENNIEDFISILNSNAYLHRIEIKDRKDNIIYNEDRYGRFQLGITMPFKLNPKEKYVFYNLRITKV